MRGCFVLLTLTLSALAQKSSPPAIPPGVPLRVALDRKVAIKHVGEAVHGRLVEPVYVFDRLALPAGSIVEGHIAEIGGIPFRRRLISILSGDFTPPREVRAQFDAVVLSDRTRLPLRTFPARGTAHTVRIVMRGQKPKEHASALDKWAAVRAFRQPGKLTRLKSRLFAMLPYHRRAWPAGTMFDALLQQPLTAPLSHADVQADQPAVAGSAAEAISARLLTPLSSATARRGAQVEAVVTRPLFSAAHRLLIPEGSRLLGEVVKARPARRLHRSGTLLFVFHEVHVQPGAVQSIQGYLEGVQADYDAHLALNSEGAAHVASPKTRFIFPAIAASVAGLSFHQDYNAQGVPDRDSAGRAESGAVGLGLIGTLVAQIGPRAVASGIAVAGAAWSVYATFIARGANVVLPANTAVRINLKARAGVN